MRPAGCRVRLSPWLVLAAGALGAACAREDRPPSRPGPAPQVAAAPAAPVAHSAASEPTGAPDAGPDSGPEGSPPARPPCRCLYDLDPSTRSMRICEIDEPDHRGSTECIGPNR